jgi:hypothetical protein
VHALYNGLTLFIQRNVRAPAIGETRYPAQGHIRRALCLAAAHPQPDGDRALHGQRIETGMANMVPFAVKIHHLLRP